MPAGKQIFEALKSQGIIRMEDGTYLAMAADGVEVQLGMDGDEAAIYRYLEDSPSPTQW